MKNIYVIVGIVLLFGIGYAIFRQPQATPSVEATDLAPSGASVGAADQTTYSAGAYQDFSQVAYEQALADGKTVILDFHADWCPTCRANEPIITSVFNSNTDTNIVGFKVDYDNEVELKRTFNVVSQSTIIKTSANGDTRQLGPGPVTTGSFTAFIQS